jgi:hypothetical protein
MKLLLVFLISMVMVLGGGPAFAGSSRGATYQGYSSGPLLGTVLLDTRGAVIYNITLDDTTSSNATIAIYDQATLPIDTLAPYNETAIYEVEVTTSTGSANVSFGTAPLNTFNGVVAQVSNGTGFLNYQP